MSKLKFGQHTINLPHSRIARMALGVALIMAGVLGFLPVLGFWMIPLGLLVLSVDLPVVRRKRREWTVTLGTWLTRKYPKLAKRMGVNGSSRRARRTETGHPQKNPPGNPRAG